LTTGYAYQTAATSRSRLSPGFGDPGGHTLALGAEGSWNQVTFTIGYARLIAPAETVAPGATEVDIINPFGAEAGTAPAAAGRHTHAHDAVGAALEIGWD